MIRHQSKIGSDIWTCLDVCVENPATRAEALKAFTRWAAFASFREATLGRIERGMLADLTVLNEDIMKIPVRSIRGVGVSMTVVGGQVVYPPGGPVEVP